MPRTRPDRLFLALGGLAFGVLLCVLLVRHTELTAAAALQLAAGANWPALAGVLLVSWLMLEAGAHKWACLDQLLDGRAPHPHRYYLRHFTWQTWLGQLLPTVATLIAGRAAVTHGGGERNWRRGFRSAMIDQLGELAIVLACIPASLMLLHETAYGFPLWLGAGLALSFLLTLLGHRLLPHQVFPPVMLWSAARITLITLRLALGALAFGLPIPTLAVVYAMPLATLTALIPLTPGNLGFAEWGWTYALNLWGVDGATAALYALSYRVLILAAQTLLLPLALIRPPPRG